MDFLFRHPLETTLISSGKLTVMKDGKPVENATIVRSAEYLGRAKQQVGKTNSSGDAHFSSLGAKSLYAQIVSKIHVYQKIWLVVEGQKIELWSGVKKNGRWNGELNGLNFQLTFDLDAGTGAQALNVLEDRFYTRCNIDYPKSIQSERGISRPGSVDPEQAVA